MSSRHNRNYVNSDARAGRLAAGIVAGLTLLRLWVAGRVGLGDAEAYYWTWSTEPALGYLDHGPSVAWLIRLGTASLGDTPLGVRAPFVLLSAVTLWLLAALAGRLAAAGKRGQAGLWAVLLLSAMPMFLVAGGAANPDVPFIALVTLFVATALRAGGTGSVGWAGAAGAVAGLACCAKFFGALLALPLLWLCWRTRRRALALVTALGGMVAAASPVLLWNAGHGWASLRYHLVERHSQPAGPSLLNLAKLIGGQLGYVQPLVLAALLAALVLLWRRRHRDGSDRILLTIALPLLAAGYLLILLVPGAEPHWPAGGYLPLLLAAATALPRWWSRRRVRLGAHVGLGLSLVIGVGFHLHVLTDWGVRLMPASYVPRYDLSNELVGWPEVADAVAAELRALPAARRVRVGGCHYTTCGQLAFAARGRFAVDCPSPRTDQFDYFPGKDGSTPRGGNLLYLRDERFPFDAGLLYRCRAVEPRREITIHRGGRPVRRFALQLCRDFGGLRARRWPPR